MKEHCSPELNPVEQLWKHIRTNYTYNRVWKSLVEMEDYLCADSAELRWSTESVARDRLFIKALGVTKE